MKESNSERLERDEFNELIDLPEEEFRTFCDGKDVGYLSGLNNLLKLTWNEGSATAQALTNDLNSNKVKKTDKNIGILNALYAKLELMEKKVFIIQAIVKERSEEVMKLTPNSRNKITNLTQ